MIKFSTFWITSIAIILIATFLVTIVGIKRNKDKLNIGISLLGIYIVIAIVMLVMITPVKTYYIDGRVYNNIENIESNKSGREYSVKVANGGTYNIKYTLSSDKNFLSMKCKMVTKNVFGMELYNQKDILFVNVAKPGMSESEKEFVLDRIAPKY